MGGGRREGTRWGVKGEEGEGRGQGGGLSGRREKVGDKVGG